MARLRSIEQKRSGRGRKKWRLLLPGASEPRLTELNPLGLQTWFFKPLTRPEQPEHSCHLQLRFGPMSVVPCRAKARPLRPRRSYFAPADEAPQSALAEGPTPSHELGTSQEKLHRWRRRVLPPGPIG